MLRVTNRIYIKCRYCKILTLFKLDEVGIFIPQNNIPYSKENKTCLNASEKYFGFVCGYWQRQLKMDALAFVASSQREAIINSRDLISLDDRINAVLALQGTLSPKKISKPSHITSSDNKQDISNIYCFGLPYQDHNYGAPMPKSNDDINNLNILADSLNTVPYIKTPDKNSNLKPPIKRQENDDSITRCICGFKHDDGYMICCDECSVWQHVDCMQLDKKNIPDEYLCDNCHPRSLNKHRAIQLQKKKLLLIGSGTSPNDSSTETEDETQPHVGLDDLAAIALLNGSSNYPINGKKRIKRRLKRKDLDTDTSNLRSNTIKKHGKFNKKMQNKTKKFEKIKIPIKKTPKNKIVKYRMQQDTYEEAQSNSYNNETRHLDLPAFNDLISVKHLDISGPLCRVAIMNDNIKGLNLIRSVRSNEIIIEYKGKVMFEKTYHLLPAKERKSGFVLYYKPNGLSLCVNTSTFANDARFIRRSCTPNSKVKHTMDNGIIRFFIYASEIIENTTELTIPFDHKSYESRCACNSSYCLVKKEPITPIRKARTRSLSMYEVKMSTPKKSKDAIKLAKSAKSPDDQQAIDALLRLAHGVVSQKSTIDDLIHVSECKDKIKSEPESSNNQGDILIEDIKPELITSNESKNLDKLPPSKIKENEKEKIKEKVKEKEEVIKKEKETVEIIPKDSKPIKDIKPVKEIKENKSPKEIKIKSVLPKVVKSPPLPAVQPSPIRRKRRSRISSESKCSNSNEIASSSADENSDAEKVEEHKLTREERKLQAIVKQFEQMENKEHKHRGTPRTSSRKVSKEVIDSIQEYKPDNKTRHKHASKKSRRQSTNSLSISPQQVTSDNDLFSPKEQVVADKNKRLLGNNEAIEKISTESIQFTTSASGSAKKRWLIQAMKESNDLTKEFKTNESIAETVESFITPFKKRRIPSESHSPIIVPSNIEIQLPETPPTTDDNKPSIDDGELNSDHEDRTVIITNTSLPIPVTPITPSEHVRKKVSLDEYRKRIRTTSASSINFNKPSISAVYKNSSTSKSVNENSLNLSSLRLRAEIEFDHISGDADNENLQYYKAYNQYQDPRYHNQDTAWQQHLSQRRLSTSATANSSYPTERPPC